MVKLINIGTGNPVEINTSNPGKTEVLGDLSELDRKLETGEITPEEHDKEFAEMHNHGAKKDIKYAIGGSTAAVVLGISPYKTPHRLSLEKLFPTKFIEVLTPESKWRFRFGHNFENSVGITGGQMLAEELGVPYGMSAKQQNGSGVFFEPWPLQYRNSRWPHCIANIDGIMWVNGEPYLTEVKTTNGPFTDVWQHIIAEETAPPWYETQIQYYLSVIPFFKGGILIAHKGGYDKKNFAVIEVPRDIAYGEEIMEACEEFAENLEKGITADNNSVEHDGVYTKDNAYINSVLYPNDPNIDIVRIPKDRRAAFERLGELDEALSEIDKELEAEINAVAEAEDALKKASEPFKARRKTIEKEISQIEQSLIPDIGGADAGYFELDEEIFTVEVKRSFSKNAAVMEMLKEKYPDAYDAMATCKPTISTKHYVKRPVAEEDTKIDATA